MDPAATAVWPASRPTYDDRGFGDFYSRSALAPPAAGHLDPSGASPWSAPPASLAPNGLDERQQEDTVGFNKILSTEFNLVFFLLI